MLPFAIKSFIKDLKNHILYLLFLTFSISAITLFANLIVMQDSYINVSLADDLVGVISEPKLTSLIVIAMVVFLGFYAFQFYLKNQSKLLSIFRIGGSGFYKILIYMLLQLIIIFIVAIVLGVNLGFLFYQFVNQYISSLLGIQVVRTYLRLEVVVYIAIITGIELIYLLLLTIGHVYRNQIRQLLGYQVAFDPLRNASVFHLREKIEKYHKYILIIGVVIYSYFLIKGIYSDIVYASIFFVAIIYPICLRDLLSNVIRKIKEKCKDTNLFIGLSHLDFSIRKVFHYMSFLSILLVLIAYFIVLSYANIENLIYYICVYLTISLVFLVSILYQLIISKEMKQRDMQQLRKLGKTKKELRRILAIEINGFYGLLLLMTFFFPTINLIIAIFNQNVDATIVLLLIGCYIGFTIVLYIISNMAYQSIVNHIE